MWFDFLAKRIICNVTMKNKVNIPQIIIPKHYSVAIFLKKNYRYPIHSFLVNNSGLKNNIGQTFILPFSCPERPVIFAYFFWPASQN